MEFKMKMKLSQYFAMGGTLETLHNSGDSIIDDYDQPPFEERKLGRISKLELIGQNVHGINLYKVTYASGTKRDSLGQGSISVMASIKLDI